MNVNEDISQQVELFLEEFKNNNFSENVDKNKLLALLHENFNKINELLNKLNSINLNENNILEILSFLLYSGGFFNNCKNDILQNLYNLYIIKCIKYYSSFIDTFLIQECSQTEINMSNHILNFSKKESNMNYTSILFEITKYTKNIFMESKNNYRYQNDEEYRKKIVNIYIHINTEDYLLYLIMKEHSDEFSSLLSSLKNNIISKNDIIEILNNYDDKRSIVERIYDKILLNDKNCDYSDLKEFILNLLKNGMKTNYYFEDKFKSILSLYDNQFITLFTALRISNATLTQVNRNKWFIPTYVRSTH